MVPHEIQHKQQNQRIFMHFGRSIWIGEQAKRAQTECNADFHVPKKSKTPTDTFTERY